MSNFWELTKKCLCKFTPLNRKYQRSFKISLFKIHICLAQVILFDNRLNDLLCIIIVFDVLVPWNLFKSLQFPKAQFKRKKEQQPTTHNICKYKNRLWVEPDWRLRWSFRPTRLISRNTFGGGYPATSSVPSCGWMAQFTNLHSKHLLANLSQKDHSSWQDTFINSDSNPSYFSARLFFFLPQNCWQDPDPSQHEIHQSNWYQPQTPHCLALTWKTIKLQCAISINLSPTMS